MAAVKVMAMDQPREVTPRERVVAAYKGQRADRVPAYPIAGSFAGCLDGLSIEEYCTNPKKAVKAMINYYERYQPDIMIAFNDLAKEAEAVGCRVKYSDYVVPSIDQHVLQDDKGALARLEVPDPFRQARLPAFLEQCEALSAQKFPSALGAVLVGPWTIAMLMRNPELMCLDTLEDPEFVHELMRFATEFAKRMGDAVLTTKIGLSYSDPTASCSLVGPDTYREFIKPYHKELVDYFKAKKVGTTVHICGTTHQIHEDLVDVGFVAITIDLDQQADPKLYVDQLDRLITLGNQRNVVAIGNVDVTIFERATKAEIEAEVRRCIDTAGSRSRFVLSTSCELPPRANPDCVKWFMEAAREYGRWERILGA
jgi:uroporphyrinogen decarboxylase